MAQCGTKDNTSGVILWELLAVFSGIKNPNNIYSS